jgi:uncharacterized protein (DUF2267 family)
MQEATGMTYDEFIAAVQERAGGIPREEAEKATWATLEVLADRITAGEANDLAAQLPKALKEALRPHKPEAEPFGLKEFVDRVAQRLGETPVPPKQLVRAVLTTVREGVTGGEFEDVMQQLPDEFWEVVEPTSWRGGPLPEDVRRRTGATRAASPQSGQPPPPA